MRLDNKLVHHYADASLEKRYVVYLTELYCSKLLNAAKAKNLFYFKPKSKFKKEEECWYYDVPVGYNILSFKLNDMFVAAGLDCEGIHYHSLQATGISELYNSGVAEKLIMPHSGYLSVEGIRSYERTSDEQHQQVSSVLSSSSVTNYAINNSAVTNSSIAVTSISIRDSSSVVHHLNHC